MDVADRMRKTLRHSDIGVQEMAEYLGVSRNTVGSWINGRIRPDVRTMRLWALRTGYPYAWLTTGLEPDGPGRGSVGPEGLEPSTYVEALARDLDAPPAAESTSTAYPEVDERRSYGHDVACSACGAPVGRHCITAGGAVAFPPHKVRIHDAHAQRSQAVAR